MWIYKITNIQNNKIYIGQTIRPIEQRFHRHLNDALNNIFDTVISCAKACGIQNGKTSISARLNGQIKSPYKKTWIFEYYDE